MSSNDVDVVISGGSMDGICDATGFLKAITEDLGLNIVSAAGTSAGGVVLGVYAAGYSASEIEKLILNARFSEFVDIPRWYNFLRIFSALKNQYLSDGSKIRATLDHLTDLKTFKDSRIDLHIVGTDMARKEIRDFNRTSDPDMSMALAMQITCCVPGCFKPVEYEGTVWYDGSIRSHYPAELLPQADRPLYGFLASHTDQTRKISPMRPLEGLYGFLSMIIDNTLDVNIRHSTSRAIRQPVTVKHQGPGGRGWDVSRAERVQMIETARLATLAIIGTKV